MKSSTLHKPLFVFGSYGIHLKASFCSDAFEVFEMPLSHFSCGEWFLKKASGKKESTVRGREVFLVQSVPGHDALMQLIFMTTYLKRLGAHKITLCLPYLFYLRQEQKEGEEGGFNPVKDVVDLLENAGADEFVLLDPHGSAPCKLFKKPVRLLSPLSFFCEDIQQRFCEHDLVVVSPDQGSGVRAKVLASKLSAPFIVFSKTRFSEDDIKLSSIKENLTGKTCIIVDDMVDSGQTLIQTAKVLKQQGAQCVHAYVTHGVFSRGVAPLGKSDFIETLTLTDSFSKRPLEAEKGTSCQIKYLDFPQNFFLAHT